MDRKKIIIISGVVAILIIAGILIYYFAVGGQKTTTNGLLNQIFPTAGEKQPAGTGKGAPPATTGQEKTKPALIQLTDVAVSGIKAVGGGRIRYIEKSLGHLYEIAGNGENKIRISNTTIPKIFSVKWSREGDRAVLSYLGDDFSVRQFSALFSGTSTEGIFLPANTSEHIYAPHKDRLLYIINSDNNYRIIAADPDNSATVEIYSTPFADFTLNWPAGNIISLLTTPSSYAEGYLYKIDLQKNTFEKVIGQIAGLEALWSPDAKYILISDSQMHSKIISADGKIIGNGLDTLADKCVWSATTTQSILYCGIPQNAPTASYPDDWYKGKVSFDDKITKINISDGVAETLLEDKMFDVEEMSIDLNDEYLYFKDKKDGTLWGLKL